MYICYSAEAKRANFQELYTICECVTKQKINSNNYNRLLQKDWRIGTTATVMLASTADYVILSFECFPLIKRFEIQNFEPILFHKHKLACFKLAVNDERKKSEVNFEADYVSDSFMDKTQKLM